MANEPSKTPITAKPQSIPLSKIHDLPGVYNPKPQDKSLGSMVLSIETSGIKEPVILRQSGDGEYQLLSGYRRRRACELAKKSDIPAYVYEMTMQDAIAYRKAVKNDPNAPIPGKIIDPSAEKSKSVEIPAAPGDKDKKGEIPTAPGDKGKKDEAPAAPSDKDKKGEAPATTGDKDKKDEAPGDKDKKDEAPAAPGDKDKKDEAPAVPGEKEKKGEAPAASGDKEKKGEAPAAPSDKDKKDEAPAAPGDKDKKGEAPVIPSDKEKEEEAPATLGDKNKEEIPATPAVAELEAKVEAGEHVSVTDLAAAEKAEREAQHSKNTPSASTGKDKPSQTAATDKGKEAGEALTAASEGPAGTSITQIFEKRLNPPDEASRKSLPMPKEGESYFITLHPAYLEKSVYNNFSVDTESENFKELLKSVELVGIKDPVLARFSPEGKLEILSGQRRHIAATLLNQAVPTIIQKIDDADAKIMVADGNLHRDKISSYDLSRALRMKMEGMKQKAGRRKKGYSANELQSDAKLAQEMGMTVSKLNRLIRMSEAIKGVCDLVDEGRLTISVASEISALKPKTQDEVLHLLDLGYKATNERISRMKKAEAGGKNLNEMDLRSILDDKDIAPKQPEPVKQPELPAAPTETTDAATNPPPIPASPDVPAVSEVPSQNQAVDPPAAQEIPPQNPPTETNTSEQTTPPAPPGPSEPAKENDPFKGGQERPEVTKVILTGDRLRKYFPDVSMTPREIEESVYSALEERRQRQLKEQKKTAIFKKGGKPTR